MPSSRVRTCAARSTILMRPGSTGPGSGDFGTATPSLTARGSGHSLMSMLSSRSRAPYSSEIALSARSPNVGTRSAFASPSPCKVMLISFLPAPGKRSMCNPRGPRAPSDPSPPPRHRRKDLPRRLQGQGIRRLAQDPAQELVEPHAGQGEAHPPEPPRPDPLPVPLPLVAPSAEAGLAAGGRQMAPGTGPALEPDAPSRGGVPALPRLEPPPAAAAGGCGHGLERQALRAAVGGDGRRRVFRGGGECSAELVIPSGQEDTVTREVNYLLGEVGGNAKADHRPSHPPGARSCRLGGGGFLTQSSGGYNRPTPYPRASTGWL